MRFVLEICCNNAAFRPESNDSGRREEIARILRDAAFDVESGKPFSLTFRDSNGNKVGTAGLVKTS